MINIDSEQFENIVTAAIDDIPAQYATHIKNLAFVVEESPSDVQRQRLQLHPGESLYGLYEGIPLTKRGSNYNLVLPDKITIFKQPIERSSSNLDEVKEKVRHTVWHEVAHYYGLDHFQIDELEAKSS